MCSKYHEDVEWPMTRMACVTHTEKNIIITVVTIELFQSQTQWKNLKNRIKSEYGTDKAERHACFGQIGPQLIICFRLSKLLRRNLHITKRFISLVL